MNRLDGGLRAAVLVVRTHGEVVFRVLYALMQHEALIAALATIVGFSCSNPADDDRKVNEEPPISGSVIVAIVQDSTTSAPLAFSRVVLKGPSSERLVLTDAFGRCVFRDVDSGTYRISLERAGYDTTSFIVPEGVNDTSTIDLFARRKSSVPHLKPQGTGRYRTEGRVLHSDPDGDGIYSLARIQGAAYSPAPIGSNGEYNAAVLQLSFRYLDTLNANTIRTYSGASPELLTTAHAYGIRVIVGYWVDTHANMADPAFRRATELGFRNMVRALRSYPAVAFWNLGNEQNLPYINGNTPLWYDLAEELATAAFEEEGSAYHPVCISNGDVTNIGDPSMKADDASLRYVDLWASNIYKLNLSSALGQFRTATTKPLVITEFGIDALDDRIKQQYEGVQLLVDSLNWTQIKAAEDVCIGGTVFEFTDEWWKGGDPLSHDYGGYTTNQHPDGYSNEEWWGLVAITPDVNGDGMDEWRPRSAFRMFQRAWQTE